jgi:outer membrane lipopolysaccharide assembly protein LptE/RlpB
MRHIALIACLALLAACGFQLQGRQQMPASLATLQVEPVDRHSDFTVALRRALASSGVHLVDKAATDGAEMRWKNACCRWTRATFPPTTSSPTRSMSW